MLLIYPQVHVDIGAISWILPEEEFYRYLQTLVDAGFGSRIMFGSDQMVWPETLPAAIERIQNAPFLSERERRDILYNNAARFLGLSEEEIEVHGADPADVYPEGS